MKSNDQLLPNHEKIISITDMALLIARNIKLIILIPSFLCLFLLIYISFFRPSYYISVSKIMSSSSGSSVKSQAYGIAAQFGIPIPSEDSEAKWVYPEIIRSRTLSRAMLKRKFYDSISGKEKTLLEILINPEKNSDENQKFVESLGIDILLGMISVDENIKTSTLTISVASKNPLLSTNINEALIQELDRHQREYNKTRTNQSYIFIENLITEKKKELEFAEEKLKEFSDRNRRMENSPGLLLQRQRLDREVIVLTGVFTTLKQQLETVKIESVKESDYVVVIDPPEMPLGPKNRGDKLLFLFVGLFGLGLAISIAFLKSYLESSKKKKKLYQAQSILFKNIRELLSLSFFKNKK
tara:strand:- start:893 stop:1960 length:1068 start_codon:yes stop_codon:yes gene_type:complete